MGKCLKYKTKQKLGVVTFCELKASLVYTASSIQNYIERHVSKRKKVYMELKTLSSVEHQNGYNISKIFKQKKQDIGALYPAKLSGINVINQLHKVQTTLLPKFFVDHKLQTSSHMRNHRKHQL